MLRGIRFKKKERINWRVVYKIRARGVIDSPDEPYQNDEESSTIFPPNVDDDLNNLRDEDNVEEEAIGEGNEEEESEEENEEDEESEFRSDSETSEELEDDGDEA